MSAQSETGYYRAPCKGGWITYDLPLDGPTTASWHYRFDVDDEGWWLVKDGRRCNRKPWWPIDAFEALLAADLLWSLNEAGPTPITGEYKKAADRARIPIDSLRLALRTRSYGLWLRKLIR